MVWCGGSGGNSGAKTGQKNAKMCPRYNTYTGATFTLNNDEHFPPVCVSYSYDDPEFTDQGFITPIPTLGMAIKK